MSCWLRTAARVPGAGAGGKVLREWKTHFFETRMFTPQEPRSHFNRRASSRHVPNKDPTPVAARPVAIRRQTRDNHPAESKPPEAARPADPPSRHERSHHRRRKGEQGPHVAMTHISRIVARSHHHQGRRPFHLGWADPCLDGNRAA